MEKSRNERVKKFISFYIFCLLYTIILYFGIIYCIFIIFRAIVSKMPYFIYEDKLFIPIILIFSIMQLLYRSFKITMIKKRGHDMKKDGNKEWHEYNTIPKLLLLGFASDEYIKKIYISDIVMVHKYTQKMTKRKGTYKLFLCTHPTMLKMIINEYTSDEISQSICNDCLLLNLNETKEYKSKDRCCFIEIIRRKNKTNVCKAMKFTIFEMISFIFHRNLVLKKFENAIKEVPYFDVFITSKKGSGNCD